MRVLYSNHTATVSGSERSLLVLLAALPPNVEAHVASPPGALTRAVEELGIPVSPITATAGSLRVHPLHTPRALAEMSLAAFEVRRVARAEHVDIVHANSIRAGIELGVAAIPRVARIVHVRDCLPPGLVSTATMRVIASTATTVVANSQYTAARVRAAAPRAPLEVVYPAIDADQFDPARIDRAAARGRLGVAGTRQLLLGVVAQLSPWKGQRTAIEALRLLRDDGIDAHLLLIGSAKFVAAATRFDNRSYVASLERLIAEAGLGERVSWLGERDDVPELIRAMDALLLPSEEEPFGRALLEAMSLEVPVLATNVGGPVELIRDGREGYLLPPDDPAAWARAARRLVADPRLIREMGRAGRMRIREGFDSTHHIQAVLSMYERALARSSAPTSAASAARRRAGSSRR